MRYSPGPSVWIAKLPSDDRERCILANCSMSLKPFETNIGKPEKTVLKSSKNNKLKTREKEA